MECCLYQNPILKGNIVDEKALFFVPQTFTNDIFTKNSTKNSDL